MSAPIPSENRAQYSSSLRTITALLMFAGAYTGVWLNYDPLFGVYSAAIVVLCYLAWRETMPTVPDLLFAIVGKMCVWIAAALFFGEGSILTGASPWFFVGVASGCIAATIFLGKGELVPKLVWNLLPAATSAIAAFAMFTHPKDLVWMTGAMVACIVLIGVNLVIAGSGAVSPDPVESKEIDNEVVRTFIWKERMNGTPDDAIRAQIDIDDGGEGGGTLTLDQMAGEPPEWYKAPETKASDDDESKDEDEEKKEVETIS